MSPSPAAYLRTPYERLSFELVDRGHIRFPCDKFREDYVGFCKTILGYEPWSKQVEMAASVIEGASAEGVPFRVLLYGGRKIGKSRTLASIAHWWYCSWPDGTVSIVMPTEKQILDIIWKEITILYNESGLCLDCRDAERKSKRRLRRPCPHSARIDGKLPTNPTPKGLMSTDGKRVVYADCAKSVKTIIGHSGPRVLYIVDEAVGVSKELFEGIDGNIGGVVNGGIIMGCNPIDINSYAGQQIEKGKIGKGEYKLVHSSSWDTPNAQTGMNLIEGLATRYYCEHERDTWGEKSARYIEHVLGEHAPKEAGYLVTSRDYYHAKLRYDPGKRSGTLYLGVDIAGGSGGDLSVIAPRQGDQLWQLVIVPDTVEVLAAEIERLVSDTTEDVVINYDYLGEGLNLLPHVKRIEQKYAPRVRVNPLIMNASGGPQYAMLRDFLYAAWSNAIKGWLGVPEDENLEEETLTLQYDKNPEKQTRYGFGKDRIEPKPLMRKKLKRSPDRLDACCYSLADDDDLPLPKGIMSEEEREALEPEHYERTPSRHSRDAIPGQRVSNNMAQRFSGSGGRRIM